MRFYKKFFITELTLIIISFTLFFSSFFFSISNFYDAFENPHPNIVFFLRLSSVTIFLLSLLEIVVVLFIKKRDINNKELFIIVSLVFAVEFVLLIVTSTTYKSDNYYNENGIVNVKYEEYFPYTFSDSVYSVSNYSLPNTKYLGAYSIAGILDTEISYNIEYLESKDFLMRKQIQYQSNNFYDMIDRDRIQVINSTTEEKINYRLIKSTYGIKIIVNENEKLFIISLYGNAYNEVDYNTDEFIYNAINTYKKLSG